MPTADKPHSVNEKLKEAQFEVVADNDASVK